MKLKVIMFLTSIILPIYSCDRWRMGSWNTLFPLAGDRTTMNFLMKEDRYNIGGLTQRLGNTSLKLYSMDIKASVSLFPYMR